MTTEDDILDFAERNWGSKTLAGIALKLAEETGEIAGACVKIPEGRATVSELDKELGDALIVLSQLAAKRGRTLEDLRAQRFEEIKVRALARSASH